MQRDDWDQNWQNMNAAAVQHEALLRKSEQNPKKCMCCRPRVCAHRGAGSFRGLSWINEHSVERVLIFTVSQHLPSQCMADIILRVVLLWSGAQFKATSWGWPSEMDLCMGTNDLCLWKGGHRALIMAPLRFFVPSDDARTHLLMSVFFFVSFCLFVFYFGL